MFVCRHDLCRGKCLEANHCIACVLHLDSMRGKCLDLISFCVSLHIHVEVNALTWLWHLCMYLFIVYVVTINHIHLGGNFLQLS